MIQLSNNKLSVTINAKGAELQSIQLNGVEYLWQADATYWGKHAPVLFPVVGELKDGKYIYKGCEYKLPRHGFARNRIFKAKETTKTSVLFALQNDEETLAVYPFMFIFQVKYELKGNMLICRYIVQNTDVKSIYFSVGGHPAFKVPLANDLSYTDYVLKFNDDDVLKRYVLHNGLTSDDTETIHLDNKTLQLQPALFYNDAIVLKNIKSDEIELRTDKDARRLKFKFREFPYFGIWAAKDAPFVCLEPWCGITDNINHNYQLINKEGINELSAAERWERTWSVELY